MIIILKVIIFNFLIWITPQQYDITFQKTSTNCIVAYQGTKPIDTLCVYLDGSMVFDKKQMLHEVNGRVYKVEQKVPSIDDFSNTYILIEEWTIKDGVFSLESSLKIPYGNCYSKKLGIKLTEEGIKWSYKRGLFRKDLKGLIPYSELKESNKYYLPCK